MRSHLISITKDKGIVLLGALFVLLSVCFMSMISCELYYDGNIALMSGYFIRIALRLCVSAAVFALAYRYGEKYALKYGWVFISAGIAAALLKARLSIDILSLTNIFAVLGFAVCFHKYCVKSAVHTVLLWLSLFLFLGAAESGYLIIASTVMMGFTLASAYKNKFAGKRAARILNMALCAVLAVWSIKITSTGIIRYINLYHSDGYMAAEIRNMLGNLKLFGAAETVRTMSGNAADYGLA